MKKTWLGQLKWDRKQQKTSMSPCEVQCVWFSFHFWDKTIEKFICDVLKCSESGANVIKSGNCLNDVNYKTTISTVSKVCSLRLALCSHLKLLVIPDQVRLKQQNPRVCCVEQGCVLLLIKSFFCICKSFSSFKSYMASLQTRDSNHQWPWNRQIAVLAREHFAPFDLCAEEWFPSLSISLLRPFLLTTISEKERKYCDCRSDILLTRWMRFCAWLACETKVAKAGMEMSWCSSSPPPLLSLPFVLLPGSDGDCWADHHGHGEGGTR